MGQPSIRRELGGNQKAESIELKTFSSSLKTSLSLGTLHKDIILCIFRRLDMCHIVAMVMACKYFKSIWDSVSELDMCIYVIVPKDIIVGWKLFRYSKYPLKYILRGLNLGPWLKFKPVIQGSKIEISSGYSTKALFWVQKGCVENDTLKLLQRFVSECPQTFILFWEGDPIFFGHEILLYQELEILSQEFEKSSQEFEKSSQEPEKLKSLEYLCVRGGCLLKDWPKFFDQFPKLKCVYFRSNGLHHPTTWTVNTQKTFIMDFACIQIKSGTIE
jgi:hypothetical protein